MFEAKIIRICPVWGRFWTFQAKRIRICPVFGGFGNLRPKLSGFVPLGWILDISVQKNKNFSRFRGILDI